eukprot:2634327-Pyramimonas_sp.AAC.1
MHEVEKPVSTSGVPWLVDVVWSALGLKNPQVFELLPALPPPDKVRRASDTHGLWVWVWVWVLCLCGCGCGCGCCVHVGVGVGVVSMWLHVA